jgi:hypothetical protein
VWCSPRGVHLQPGDDGEARPNISRLPLGTIGDDGSGIKLGMSVGAKTDSLERIFAGNSSIRPKASPVCHRRPGKGWFNEEFYGARTGEALFGAGGGLAIRPAAVGDVSTDAHGEEDVFPEVQYRAIENDLPPAPARRLAARSACRARAKPR